MSEQESLTTVEFNILLEMVISLSGPYGQYSEEIADTVRFFHAFGFLNEPAVKTFVGKLQKTAPHQSKKKK